MDVFALRLAAHDVVGLFCYLLLNKINRPLPFLVQTLDRGVHVNCVGDEDVEGYQDTEVVERDKEDTIPEVVAFRGDEHVDDEEPVVDYHYGEQGYH